MPAGTCWTAAPCTVWWRWRGRHMGSDRPTKRLTRASPRAWTSTFASNRTAASASASRGAMSLARCVRRSGARAPRGSPLGPQVRAALMARQHAFARPPGLVADGRDMGTVVFPAADLKIFLTASAEERAQRRHKQLKDKGSGVSLAALSREIAERDLRDSTRAVEPLKPAPDAQRDRLDRPDDRAGGRAGAGIRACTRVMAMRS